MTGNDTGTGKSPDQSPGDVTGHFLRPVVSRSCPGPIPDRYRSVCQERKNYCKFISFIHKRQRYKLQILNRKKHYSWKLQHLRSVFKNFIDKSNLLSITTILRAYKKRGPEGSLIKRFALFAGIEAISVKIMLKY